MSTIRLGIIGVGNCASALVQGIAYCAQGNESPIGVLHPQLGGYRPEDIEIAAAFDIDRRKVGRDVSDAIWQEPNCTTAFCEDVATTGVLVHMGRILDGVPAHMADHDPAKRFEPASDAEPEMADVVEILRRSKIDVLINFLPVGAQEATCFYAQCALEARVGMVNAIPVFLASDPTWAARFTDRNVPIIGDDMKSQIGATILHRALVDLLHMRGAHLDRTYQLNIGGNTDFVNMLNPDRLVNKRHSKTEAVRSLTSRRLEDNEIRIGPSDFVPWLDDKKVAYVHVEGRAFGGMPFNIEVRLNVEDSPNAAAVAIDAIRSVKIALDRGLGGPLVGPSAFLCKHPAEQMRDADALELLLAFTEGSNSN